MKPFLILAALSFVAILLSSATAEDDKNVQDAGKSELRLVKRPVPVGESQYCLLVTLSRDGQAIERVEFSPSNQQENDKPCGVLITLSSDGTKVDRIDFR